MRKSPQSVILLVLMLSLLVFKPQTLAAEPPVLSESSSILLQDASSYHVLPAVDGFTINQLNPNSLYTLIRQVSDYGTVDYIRSQAEAEIHAAALNQLMTYYVCERYFTEQNVNRSTLLTITSEDLVKAETNQAILSGFKPGDQVSIHDLYHAMLLTSGAEAVYALVRAAAGSEQAFVLMMNVVASELGMTQTRFTNPVGFSESGSHTTLDDLSLLAAELVKDRGFREIAGTMRHTTAALESAPDGITFRHIMETYGADRQIDTSAIQGGKTGSTAESGYCFFSFRMEGDTAYLILTAKAREAGLELVDHVNFYRNMSNIPYSYPLLAAGAELAQLPLAKAGIIQTDLAKQRILAPEAYSTMQPLLTDLNRFRMRLLLPEQLDLPLEPNQEVGDLLIVDQAEGDSAELYSAKLALPETLTQETVVTTTQATEPATTTAEMPQTRTEPLPWGMIALVFGSGVLLILLAFWIRGRQQAKRRERLRRLRQLQNSYSFRSVQSDDVAKLLEEARRKRRK